jgi:sorting nexin-25
MQQLLGGTLERRVSDFIKDCLSDDKITMYVSNFGDLLESQSKEEPYRSRTATERTQSKFSAYKKLYLLVPDLAGSIVGKSNAKRGSSRFFELLQNRRLNQDLIYRILDVAFKKIPK